MEEIFVKIDNVHIVSNQGRVYSEYSKSFIGAWDEAAGRYCVIFNKNLTPIHILVAKAFPEICGYWFDGCVVHHKNFNKNDNRAENLQVLTRTEHIRIHHTGAKRTKEACEKMSKAQKGKYVRGNNKNAKAILQVSPTGETIKEWPCMKDCCEELGLSPQLMSVKFYREQSDIIHWNGYTFKRINH